MKKILLAAVIMIIAIIAIFKITSKPNTQESAPSLRSHSKKTHPSKENELSDLHKKTHQKNSPSIKKQKELARSETIRQERRQRQLAYEKASELRVKALIKTLGLNKTQAEKLSYYTKEKNALLLDYYNRKLTADDVSYLLENDYMLDAMRPHLSHAQLEKYISHKEDVFANKVDVSALKNLSKIQEAMTLDPEQREAFYSSLSDKAAKEIHNKSAKERLLDHQMSIISSPDNKMPTRLTNKRDEEINANVDEFGSILDDIQLKQYRAHLEKAPKLSDYISIGK